MPTRLVPARLRNLQILKALVLLITAQWTPVRPFDTNEGLLPGDSSHDRRLVTSSITIKSHGLYGCYIATIPVFTVGSVLWKSSNGQSNTDGLAKTTLEGTLS